jgi:outer membrane lipoprotein-sorting protein
MFAYLAPLCGACLLGTVLTARQAPPQETPLMAEEFFEDVRVLKGIPVDEFLDTMGMFAAATGLNCTDCHVDESGGSWPAYADDTQLKTTSRAMVGIMAAINKQFFNGREGVTCYSCHTGTRKPKAIPNLALQYAADPILVAPFEILEPTPGAPATDEVLDRYIAAVGGAARLGELTSIIAEGRYAGYDDFEDYPVEVFAKAPNQRTTILHSQYGDITTTFDGRSGWLASPIETKPAPVIVMSGGNLQGLAIEAQLSFPGQIKQALTDWIPGPLNVIDDREVRIIQGRDPSGTPVKLYFDEESGLLVRLVRYSSNSPVGRVPTQVDFEDYRDVSGIQFPFKVTSTWTNGRYVYQFANVQINPTIPAARFARPVPPPWPAAP